MTRVQLTRAEIEAEINAFRGRLRDLPARIGAARNGCQGEGRSQRQRIAERDGHALFSYGDPRHDTSRAPILIIYALINRPYVTDLSPDRSLIGALVARRWPVYLLEWASSGETAAQHGLHDYIGEYLPWAVELVNRTHDVEAVNLLGICQGGTFSACYAALNPRAVRALITMATPVDFHTPEDRLAKLAKYIDVARVTTLGDVPGEAMNHLFQGLKPWRLMAQKYLQLVDMADDAAATACFARLEQWIFDSPAQGASVAGEFISSFYQANALLGGGLHIGPARVTLANLSMPILNLYGERDHLVPAAASRALRDLVATDKYTEMGFDTGHIGLFVSSEAVAQVPQAIDTWLRSLG